MTELPRYASWDEVPRDLRPANDLRFDGLEPQGDPVALVVLGDREVELFRSTDATPRQRPAAADPRAPIGAAGSTLGRASQRVAVALPGTSRLLARQQRGDIDAATTAATARADLAELLASPFVVIDTETTGLGYADEIVEITIIAPDGRALVDTLVRPRSGRVPPAVSRVHGLTMHDLADAPTWAEVYDAVLAATDGRRVVAWNAPFDERMVRQSARAWSLPQRLKGFECAMKVYASCSGARFGRAKLERAAAALGLLAPGAQQHRAAADARLTLAVLSATLGRRE